MRREYKKRCKGHINRKGNSRSNDCVITFTCDLKETAAEGLSCV